MNIQTISEAEFCEVLDAMQQLGTIAQKVELGSVVLYCGESPHFGSTVLFQDALSGTMLVIRDAESLPAPANSDDEIAKLIAELD